VSSFYGHGKATAFNIIMSMAQQLQGLQMLGMSTIISAETELAGVKLVAATYKCNMPCNTTNDIRCAMAASGKKITAKDLPPSMDAFRLHLLRACYQLIIWKNACIGMHDLPDPQQFGYDKVLDLKNTNQLIPKMMSLAVAAPELLNDLICTCPIGGCHVDCVCMENEQPCTAECGCASQGHEMEHCNNLYTWQPSADIDVDFVET
jgi:hypothetical protein